MIAWAIRNKEWRDDYYFCGGGSGKEASRWSQNLDYAVIVRDWQTATRLAMAIGFIAQPQELEEVTEENLCFALSTTDDDPDQSEPGAQP